MSLMMIATDAAPPNLRGKLCLWLLEVRAGVFVGDYSKRVRDMLWQRVRECIGDGNAVLIWSTNAEQGFAIETCGNNRRIPINADGFQLIKYSSEDRTE